MWFLTQEYDKKIFSKIHGKKLFKKKFHKEFI